MILCITVLTEALWSDKLSRFEIEAVDANYITAGKDPALMKTVMLEYYTTIFKDNEEIIGVKGICHNIALVLVILCSIAVGISVMIIG